MKKKKWGLMIFAAALIISCTMPELTAPVYAGQWKMGVHGYWYDFENGSYATGWNKIGNVWYYFNRDGYMKTGWQKIDGTWYYFGASGVMHTGWQWVDGKWYYLGTSGAMHTGWQWIRNTWYYFEGSGAMHTRWLTIGENRYFLKESGALAVGAFTDGSFQYITDENGAVYRNVTRGNKRFDENGCIMMKNKDGYWEYVPSEEVLVERKKEELQDNLWERRYRSLAEFEEDVRQTLEGFVSDEEMHILIDEAVEQFEKDFDMDYNEYIWRYGRKH